MFLVQRSTVCAPAALQILPLSQRDGDRRHVDSVTVGPWDSLACMLTQAPSLADQMILLLFVCSFSVFVPFVLSFSLNSDGEQILSVGEHSLPQASRLGAKSRHGCG